jgi:hypothetical protein
MKTDQPLVQLTHSVEADVSPAFAWQFRTDPANWNDPPATFTFEGPFENGSRGATVLPGQPPLHWQIVRLQPGKSFGIEMLLDRAIVTFDWQFEELSPRRTRITQSITLSGENGAAYAAQVEAGFGPKLAGGMNRIAAEMAAAERR